MNRFKCPVRTLTLALFLLLLLPAPVFAPTIPAPDIHAVYLEPYTIEPAKESSSRAAEYREIICIVTAYCSCHKCTGKHPGDQGYGITASGTRAQYGTLAADWDMFEPGTRLIVPGYGEGIVEDRGVAIKGRKLDVWFAEHSTALAWGRRQVRVRVEE